MSRPFTVGLIIAFFLLQFSKPALPSRGRPRRWHENMQARFEEGTLDRMSAVLKESETKTDFVNAAGIREIERREKRK
jgi:hypothetical protein